MVMLYPMTVRVDAKRVDAVPNMATMTETRPKDKKAMVAL